MRPEARLAATIELLEILRATPRPADAVMRDYFRSRRYIGSTDRAEIATAAWSVVRATARLNWWLKTPALELPGRLHVLAYEVLGGKNLVAVGKICSGAQYAPARLNEDEERALTPLERHTLDHPDMPASVRLECPDWAYEKLRALYGAEKTAAILAALLHPAALDLRANTLKSTRAAMLAALQGHGLDVVACPFSPLGLRAQGRPNIGALEEVKDGRIEVQDEAAQVAALLLGAKPGERVVDFCAGAGGKTLALAAAMANKGKIVACDVLEGRLKKAALRFRRAGAFNIETRLLKDEHDPWVKKHKASFDRVFVDAPCSGLGTWRRNPDSRWRRLGPDLAELIALQTQILGSAARLVRPGGRLLYATCSLLPDENDNQVAQFLAAHNDFQLRPIADIWKESVGTQPPAASRETLTLDPATHGTDGFFVAVMERRPAA